LRRYDRLSDIQEQLRLGHLSCSQLVDHYLSNIAATRNLNAFLEVFQAEARKAATQQDTLIARGEWRPLTGAVIAIKDVLCFKGHKVSASSRILEGFESLFSATAIQRLVDAGAIIIGRTNCDEFAMGSSNENSAYGNVLNGLDPTRVPGGSSGGSAVAVQQDCCLAALGTDTGGSVRLPASYCGLIGMKPTYGRISRYGLLAYGSSFDQISPFTRSIEDMALLLRVMAGSDEFDSTASRQSVPDYPANLSADRKYSIRYIKEVMEHPALDEEIRDRCNDVLDWCRAEGHEVQPWSFPYIDYLVPAYYILTTAEASSNLARYDGIHYGYRAAGAADIDSVYRSSRSAGFGAEVKRRIMLGTFVLSAGYYEAYYGTGQKIRRLIHDSTRSVFREADLVFTPTAASTAFKLGEKAADPVSMYLSDIFTVQAPLAGLPAISLPLGNHSNGLPFGVQLMADKFKESHLLTMGQKLMQFHNASVVPA
jgi:aspartyl-tRNA(Asn)/glutamyl-tRNA(Gln) amidotransferase subunit A